LAVVLAELVQNAIEHAFLDFEAEGDEDGVHDSGDRDAIGTIRVDLQAEGGQLRVEVLDDGSGLPDGFDIDDTQSLGLSIVRDLVRSQLEGTITMRNRGTAASGVTGTLVAIELPARDPQPIGQ
jgi:two-component sensor histidine kinase